MTQSVQTQAQLLTAFADGQPIASITPEDARNLIISIASQAIINESAPYLDLGSISGTTQTVLWSAGALQVGTLATSSAVTLTVTGSALGTGWFAALTLYLINNSSGNGQLVWPTNVTWIGSTPQPIPQASVATKFRLESLDGGDNWSIVNGS